MNIWNVIVYGVAAILLLPVLLAGGWVIGAVLVLAWLGLAYGTSYGLDVLKERQSGATAAKYKRKNLSIGDDDDGRWNR